MSPNVCYPCPRSVHGSWGMVKVQPSRPLEQSHLAARRLDFNHPPTAVGGIEERENASDVGRTLTIPQLPLGGLKNDPQRCGICIKRRLHAVYYQERNAYC